MSPEAGTPADGDEPAEDRPQTRSRLNQIWPQETEAQLWQAVRLYGCRWGRIAQLRPFTSRSVQSLRCHHERIVLRMINEPWYEARIRRLARNAGVVAGTDELHARCHASTAFTEPWATRDMDVIQARSCRENQRLKSNGSSSRVTPRPSTDIWTKADHGIMWSR